MSRRKTISMISQSLGERELIWGGLRADDIEAISDLPQVAASFSIVGGHDRGGAVPGLDYEDLARTRVDLDCWDIEDHLDAPASHEFREALLRRLAAPSALLPYRSSNFLSAILFARRDRCLDLGLFGAHQAMFDHKPWVETLVARAGIPRVEWLYVADEERWKARQLLDEGPVALRVSRSSGGTGVLRVDDPSLLEESWPLRPEAFVGVTRFLDNAIPVNIGATVWSDGVTMRHPSVQLIGIPGCTTRPFGYCGNDFGLAAELEDSTLDTIEASVEALGSLLRSYGYIGTFGVDFLVHRGVPLFSEINPRFQGSTHASSQLSSEAGESCVMLDHLAAVLGHPAPPSRRLSEVTRTTPPFAHVVLHQVDPEGTVPADRLMSEVRAHPRYSRVDVVAKPGMVTEPGAVVARVAVRDRMTRTGFDLVETWAWLRRFCVPGERATGAIRGEMR